MNKSSFPSGVAVGQVEMQYQTSADAESVLERFIDTAGMGVVSGLTVSVNANNPRLVDIAAGHGYAPNGERCELATASLGLGLADYTSTVDNYVCLLYTEVASRPEAHASDGTTRTTRVTRSATPLVRTLAQIQAMPASDDSDLTREAQDRLLVCASVRADGTGIVISGNITNPSSRDPVISMTQPVTIPGVEVIVVDQTTRTTDEVNSDVTPVNPLASIAYTVTGYNPLAATVKYRAPGDTVGADSGYGTAVVVTGGGAPFTLTSGNGLNTIQIGVSRTLLQTASVSESVTVFEVYGEAVARAGARDEQHRRTAGSAIPQVKNPHGSVVKDLSQVVEVPFAAFFGTNLLSSLAQALVPRQVTQQSSFSARTLVHEFILTATTRIRLYINTSTTYEITVNARWCDDAGVGDAQTWRSDDNAATSSKFAIFASGFASFAKSATAASWADGDWTSIPVFSSGLAGTANEGQVSLNGQTLLGNRLLDSAAKLLGARLVADYAATGVNVRTLLAQSQITGGGTPQSMLRVYRSNTGSLSATHVLEFVFNAAWDGTQWVKDALVSASKFQLGTAGLAFFHRGAAGATFTDVADPTGWDDSYGQMTATTLETTGSLIVGGASLIGGSEQIAGVTGLTLTNASGEYRYTAARSVERGLSPACGALGVNFVKQENTIERNAAAAGYTTWNIDAPPGSTLTQVRIWTADTSGSVNFADTWTLSAKRRDLNTNTVSDMVTPATLIEGENIITLTTLNTNFAPDDYSYYIRIEGDGSSVGAIIGLSYTYTATINKP